MIHRNQKIDVIGFAEMIWLFHALAGLSVGWLSGSLHSVPRGIGASMGGCTLGLAIGFLATRAPGEVIVVAARISRSDRLIGALFALSGHLVWLGMGITFWWLCFGILCS